MDQSDQLDQVYEMAVHWADILIIATPIRWGAASSLYYKMVERMNCIQNQITLNNKVLIRNKVAGFIITGGQDNIQAVAGQMMGFFARSASCCRSFRSSRIRGAGKPRTWSAMSHSWQAAKACATAPATSCPQHGDGALPAGTRDAHASVQRGGRKASA